MMVLLQYYPEQTSDPEALRAAQKLFHGRSCETILDRFPRQTQVLMSLVSIGLLPLVACIQALFHRIMGSYSLAQLAKSAARQPDSLTIQQQLYKRRVKVMASIHVKDPKRRSIQDALNNLIINVGVQYNQSRRRDSTSQ